MSYLIHSEQLKGMYTYFEQAPEIAKLSASLALNQVAERKALPLLRKAIGSQIAFPTGYLDSPDRLRISRKASPNRLETVITGRDRPTSLARFAPGQTPEGSRGKSLTVQVKHGRAKRLAKAFLIRLRNDNIGLAIRLKQGETVRNKNDVKAVSMGKGLYLLYGPSVDQVMKTVATEAVAPVGDLMVDEFYRQFARLSRG